MSTLNLNWTQIHYDLTPARSQPTVLVFLHGWLLSRHYWQPLMAILSADYQCLALDLRGFGQSRHIAPEDVQGFAPIDYAQDIGQVLDILQIRQVVLVGHSLGGTIALWGAKCFPDRVVQVWCVNAGGGIYLKDEFERFRSAGQQILKFRPGWLAKWPLFPWLFTRANVPKPLEFRWGQQRVTDFVTADYTAALRSLLDSTTEAEVLALPNLVADLTQPTYFIAGCQDDIMPPKYVQYLANHHPSSQGQAANVIELDPCGHFAMLEQTHAVAILMQQKLTFHELSS
jgi:2-succinyl-6-hydroxy-2,4-cyclohexadiene-1-carboxylate synthase